MKEKQYHVDYYEAIIQLRPDDEKLMSFAEREVDMDKKVWISKKLRVKGGVDYYISSNRFARGLGRKIKKRFNGVLKESKKLYGRDKLRSKDLYRVTVCFRLNKEGL